MTTPDSSAYTKLLHSVSRGDIAVMDLPLADTAFWDFLFRQAAHPGRLKPRSTAAAAAERLLYRPLTGKANTARRQGAIAALASPNLNTRLQALRFLHEAEVTRDVLEAVRRLMHDRDSEVRIEAVRLLAKHPSPQTLPALLEALSTAFDLRGTLAAEALVNLHAAAVPGLAALLSNSDARVRWRAALCLTKIAEDQDLAVLPGLLEAIHDDSPDVAWVAADGLLALGPDAAVAVLRSMLRQNLGLVTIRALHHYAEHASPRRVFGPLALATRGSGVGSATPAAVNNALEALASQS